MLNLDKLNEKKAEILSDLAAAIREQDETKMSAALDGYSGFISQMIQDEAAGILSASDASVLALRGSRQLTSREKKYYDKLIKTAKENPGASLEQAIANIDEALPETIIDAVLEDIKTDHPLLNAVHFTNTTAITKMVTNAEGQQQAVWGELSAAIVTELAGDIKVVSMELCKLTAFMYVSNDMLELGPQWLDTYVRTTLSEATAVGCEVAIVDGTGKNQPIGMTRDISDDVTVTAGVYPRKSATTITEITPTTYGALLAGLAVSATGKPRTVKDVVLIVNPADYFTKIMPATTFLLLDGKYAHDVLPYPTTIIQSVGVPANHAVIGIGSLYDMFIGMGKGKNGKIEADGSYKFLEDVTTYKIKLFGYGKAKDDNAFAYLDITNLVPKNLAVDANITNESINTVDVTPADEEPAGETPAGE